MKLRLGLGFLVERCAGARQPLRAHRRAHELDALNPQAGQRWRWARFIVLVAHGRARHGDDRSAAGAVGVEGLAQGGKVGARKLNAPKVSGVVPNPGYVL